MAMAVMIPCDLRKSAGFAKARPIGMDNAINSCLANNHLPSPIGWGGKRNDKARQSQYLSIDNVQSLMDAWRFSEYMGLYFNRFITIHLGKLGVNDAVAMTAITAFLTLVRDHISKRDNKLHGQQFAAIWVREFGNYTDEYGECRGSHIHILAHIPNDCLGKVINRQSVWLRKATGLPSKTGALQGRKIVGYSPNKPANAHYSINAANVAAYLVKGADNAAIAKFNLPKVKYGGNIIGKRCGFTQNLGRAAQKKKGWQYDFETFSSP